MVQDLLDIEHRLWRDIWPQCAFVFSFSNHICCSLHLFINHIEQTLRDCLVFHYLYLLHNLPILVYIIWEWMNHLKSSIAIHMASTTRCVPSTVFSDRPCISLLFRYIFVKKNWNISFEYHGRNGNHLCAYFYKFLASSEIVPLVLRQGIVSVFTSQTSENLPKHAIWARKQICTQDTKSLHSAIYVTVCPLDLMSVRNTQPFLKCDPHNFKDLCSCPWMSSYEVVISSCSDIPSIWYVFR